MDLFRLHDQGQAWSVNVDLGVTATRDLVVPKPFRQDAADRIAGDPYTDRWQVVILGLAWAFRASASGQGFTLNGVSSLQTTQLWEDFSDASGRFGGAITPCYIPLQPASADSPNSDPATLQIVVAAATSGHFHAWGVHTKAAGKADLYSDSPQYEYL